MNASVLYKEKMSVYIKGFCVEELFIDFCSLHKRKYKKEKKEIG